jgi:hypothetical protein
MKEGQVAATSRDYHIRAGNGRRQVWLTFETNDSNDKAWELAR